MRRSLVAFLFITALTQSGVGIASDSTVLQPGLVVEAVASEWFSRTADVRIGDLFLTWSCGKQRSKTLRNPYDFFAAELRGPVCGNVRVQGYRAARHHTWALGETDWAITARPQFTGKAAALYLEANIFAKNGKMLEAARRWNRIANIPGPFEIWLRPWLLEHAAEELVKAERWKEVDETYRDAIDAAHFSGPAILGKVFYQYAETFLARNDWISANKYYQLALVQSLKPPNDPLAATLYLNCLGTTANRQ
jgi:hypothetical protein